MTIENGSQKRKIGFWVAVITSISTGVLVAIASEPTGEDLGAPDRTEVAFDANESIKNRPIETMTRGYVSSDSCQECQPSTMELGTHRTTAR